MNGLLLRSALCRPGIKYREVGGRSIPQAQKNRRRSFDQRRFSHARIPLTQKQPPKERTGPGTPMYHGFREKSTPAGYIFPKTWAVKAAPAQPSCTAWCAGAQNGSLDGPGIIGDHGGAVCTRFTIFGLSTEPKKAHRGPDYIPGGAAQRAAKKRPLGGGRSPLTGPGLFLPLGGGKREKERGDSLGAQWFRAAALPQRAPRESEPPTLRPGGIPAMGSARSEGPRPRRVKAARRAPGLSLDRRGTLSGKGAGRFSIGGGRARRGWAGKRPRHA